MGLKECGKGHMYDDSQYKKCPYCQQTKAKRDYPHLFALFGKKTPETESPSLALYAGPPVEPTDLEPTEKVKVPPVPNECLYAGPPVPNKPPIDLSGLGPMMPPAETPNALKTESLLANGKYRAEWVIEQDGQSFIYRGTDMLSQSRVTIYEYLPKGRAYRDKGVDFLQWSSGKEPSGWQDTKRYLAEMAAKIMRIERVPGIAWVRDVFFQNNTTYVVTDFANGETLNKRIAKSGPLDAKACFQMLCPLMDALESVHKNRLLHMDIEPENILIDGRGSACLLNLGIPDSSYPVHFWPWKQDYDSSLPRWSPFAATEMLMESSQQLKFGPWTDVYSMCATFFYAVTGTAPVNAVERLYKKYMQADIPDENAKGIIPPKIYAVLKRGLDPDYKDRILSMKALREELGAAIQSSE